MSEIKSINDFSYIMDGERFVGVKDDRSGATIERYPELSGNVVISTPNDCAIPESIANNLFIAWLCISDPSVIKDDEEKGELQELKSAISNFARSFSGATAFKEDKDCLEWFLENYGEGSEAPKLEEHKWCQDCGNENLETLSKTERSELLKCKDCNCEFFLDISEGKP